MIDTALIGLGAWVLIALVVGIVAGTMIHKMGE